MKVLSKRVGLERSLAHGAEKPEHAAADHADHTEAVELLILPFLRYASETTPTLVGVVSRSIGGNATCPPHSPSGRHSCCLIYLEG